MGDDRININTGESYADAKEKDALREPISSTVAKTPKLFPPHTTNYRDDQAGIINLDTNEQLLYKFAIAPGSWTLLGLAKLRGGNPSDAVYCKAKMILRVTPSDGIGEWTTTAVASGRAQTAQLWATGDVHSAQTMFVTLSAVALRDAFYTAPCSLEEISLSATVRDPNSP